MIGTNGSDQLRLKRKVCLIRQKDKSHMTPESPSLMLMLSYQWKRGFSDWFGAFRKPGIAVTQTHQGVLEKLASDRELRSYFLCQLSFNKHMIGNQTKARFLILNREAAEEPVIFFIPTSEQKIDSHPVYGFPKSKWSLNNWKGQKPERHFPGAPVFTVYCFLLDRKVWWHRNN